VKLWIREIEVQTGGLTFHSDDVFITFQLPFDDSAEPNTGEVVLFNLSDDSLNQLRSEEEIIVKAGYEGDAGVIFLGVVERVWSQWERADRLVRLSVGDASDRWFEGIISQSFPPGVQASEVAQALLDEFGLEVGMLDLPEDIEYKRGYSAEGALKDELKRLAKDCGAKLHITQGTVYMHAPEEGTEMVTVLNPETGLVFSPERLEDEEEGWNVTSLLNHRIQPDVRVKVESEAISGTFRVRSGAHVCNEADFLTQMEVVE